MHRRRFLAATAAAALARTLQADELPTKVIITRVVGFNLTSRRNKLAGKNARLDVHGDRGHDRMLRIYTNAGIEGIGNCGIGKDAAAMLLGKNPFDYFQPAERRVTGPFGAGTMPLWDLAGKLLKKPVYDLAAYKPFMGAGAIDVFQGDMNHFGLEGILTEAAMAKPHGGKIAPHNWGSLIGYYMELHLGRAVGNFYRAEHDPLTTDVIVADGYWLENGFANVPGAPGFSLAINEAAFAREAEIRFDVKA